MRFYFDTFFENILFVLTPLPKHGLNTAPRKETVILSLTSYPARIDQAYVAIKSLMCQSVKADKIILWLAESQFKTFSLPKKFNRLVKRGLDIRYIEDLRSHKKYYYALQEQKPNELVITYDDDIIYERNSIKKLIYKHNEFPDCIVCNRGHKIAFGENGIKPYKEWKVRFDDGVDTPLMNIMPSTGNGCLYPYGVMPETTFNQELLKKNAFTADDIWMRFNSIVNGMFVVRTQKEVATLINVFSSQKTALNKVNDGQSENQKTVDNLIKVFPEVQKKITQSYVKR
ncbi:MAG: hypothetical protein IJQ07_06400 [Clostridia bacterium]|nr:hypothetical protein [Clostridia bacterium]